MSSFGEKLRNAREAKGLSCSQVAAQTHMLVQIVEEMEREDFHRIPAPIYGRGFVRLFADCVGLDPVPLVREFMDIYEGRRAPAVSIREVPTAPVPPPAPPTWQATVAPQPRPVVPPVPEPQPVPEPVAQPIPEPVPEPVVMPEPEPVPEPVAPPEPEPVLEPVAPPEPQPVPEPVAPPEPEPVPEPVAPPEPEPVPEPVTPPIPEPVPEPVAQPIPEPVQETQQVVRGLDLFEQAPARPFSDDEPLFSSTPAPMQQSEKRREPPPIDPNASPYLMPSDYAEGSPSAATRFRQGLSAVSSSIIKKVRSIPRRVWRMAALILGVILAIVFIVWCISKLYKATSKPGETPAAEVTPATTEQQATEQSAQAQPPEKENNTKKQKDPSAKPVKLKFSETKNLPLSDLILD